MRGSTEYEIKYQVTDNEYSSQSNNNLETCSGHI